MKESKRPFIRALNGILHKNKNWKHAELKHAITPVIRRIQLQHMLEFLSLGLQLALIAALLLSGLAFLVPFERLHIVCLISGLAIIAVVLITGWLTRPSVYQCAIKADRMGLQEKLVTACELDDRDDPIARLQRKDAIDSLRNFDLKSIKPGLPRSCIYGLIIMMAAVILLNLIPNPMERLVQEKKAVRAEISRQVEELKKTGEELAEQDAVSEEHRRELEELVDELARRLNNTDDYKEAIKEISKAEDELAALIDKISENSLDNIAGQLVSLEAAQPLAQALTDRDAAGLEAALKQLKEQLEQAADKEELAEKLKEALEKASETMTEGELKDSLSAAAGALSRGETGDAVDQLGKAVRQAVNASNAMSEARYTLQKMRGSIARTAGETEYAMGQNPNGQNSNGSKQGNGSGDDNSEQNGGRNGQGSQGSGEGQGQAGQGNQSNNGGQSSSGTGSGTTNQSGQGSNGSTVSSNGSSQTGDDNARSVYERIYAPERLGDGGEITHVPGRQTGDGTVSSEDGGRGTGELSGFIPYQDVYNEYRNEAMNSMDRRVLPPGIQEMVREYFDALGR